VAEYYLAHSPLGSGRRHYIIPSDAEFAEARGKAAYKVSASLAAQVSVLAVTGVRRPASAALAARARLTGAGQARHAAAAPLAARSLRPRPDASEAILSGGPELMSPWKIAVTVAVSTEEVQSPPPHVRIPWKTNCNAEHWSETSGIRPGRLNTLDPEAGQGRPASAAQPLVPVPKGLVATVTIIYYSHPVASCWCLCAKDFGEFAALFTNCRRGRKFNGSPVAFTAARPDSLGAVKCPTRASPHTPRQPMDYPLLPELPEPQYEALKASIAERRRILVPVVHTERGVTLDGRGRERAARELGIRNYPVETVSGLTPQQQWELHVGLNMHRRHMDRKQKQEYIRACLRHSPDISDNWLGEICGVDGETVTRVRRKMEATSEIRRFEVFRCKDGKKRRFTSVFTATARQADQAAEALRKLGKHHPGRTIRLVHAERLARRLVHQRHRNGPAPKAPRDCKLECCDFRELKARGVHLIFTDPCWSDKGIWPDLGKWAAESLRPGGILAAYTGQAFLNAAMEGLGRHLRYHWMCSMNHPAEKTWLHRWRVKSGWAPLVLFSKGRWPDAGRPYFLDIYFGAAKDKEYDEQQQSLEEAMYYIETLSDPGALICDPFGGSFTTAHAATLLHRRFIGCDLDPGKVTGGLHRLADVKP
jgi:hypothetical protein